MLFDVSMVHSFFYHQVIFPCKDVFIHSQADRHLGFWELSEPLTWCQGSQVSMHVVRGSPSLFSSHGRGIGPENVLKKDSRGLSWVEAGNPGFHRLVPVTSGSFSACL